METDASDFALGAVLLQMGEGEKLHHVAFHSRKSSRAEINYKIHYKVVFAIMDFFQEWRHFFEGASHHITLYTDHKNLQHFIYTRV